MSFITRKVYEALSKALLGCHPGEGHIPSVTESLAQGWRVGGSEFRFQALGGVWRSVRELGRGAGFAEVAEGEPTFLSQVASLLPAFLFNFNSDQILRQLGGTSGVKGR